MTKTSTTLMTRLHAGGTPGGAGYAKPAMLGFGAFVPALSVRSLGRKRTK